MKNLAVIFVGEKYVGKIRTSDIQHKKDEYQIIHVGHQHPFTSIPWWAHQALKLLPDPTTVTADFHEQEIRFHADHTLEFSKDFIRDEHQEEIH